MEIKNVEVYGLSESMVRSGYPMKTGEPENLSFVPFKSDCTVFASQKRSERLAKTPIGSGDSNFLKGIIVQLDIKYSQYFALQLQRYNFVDIISSQSKMHKITSIDDIADNCNEYVFASIIEKINDLILVYNDIKMKEGDTGVYYDSDGFVYTYNSKKELFQYIISNLPMGFELWMGISTNYLQLKTIYSQRCKHKHRLYEWEEFGKFIENLPMSNFITGKNE